jgi:hypothetical protein
MRLIATDIREPGSILAPPNLACSGSTRARAGMTAAYGSIGASSLWHPRHCFCQFNLSMKPTQTSHRNRQFARPQFSQTQPDVSEGQPDYYVLQRLLLPAESAGPASSGMPLFGLGGTTSYGGLTSRGVAAGSRKDG